MDWQTLFNIALSILSFLAAWIFKRNFDAIDKQQDKISDLERKIYGVEISLPK